VRRQPRVQVANPATQDIEIRRIGRCADQVDEEPGVAMRKCAIGVRDARHRPAHVLDV